MNVKLCHVQPHSQVLGECEEYGPMLFFRGERSPHSAADRWRAICHQLQGPVCLSLSISLPQGRRVIRNLLSRQEREEPKAWERIHLRFFLTRRTGSTE